MMKRFIKTGYYGLLVITAGIFIYSLLCTMRDIQNGQDKVVNLTVLNYWNVSQARLELERTIAALDSYVGKSGDISKADLIDRFEIFWSRLPLLVEGEQSEGVVELTDAELIIPNVIKSMEELESMLVGIDVDDREEIRKIRGELRSFIPLLQDIYLRIHHASESGSLNQQVVLNHLYTEHIAYLLGVFVCGLIFFLSLLKETREAVVARRLANHAKAELEAVIDALPISIDAVDRKGRRTLLNDYGCKALEVESGKRAGKRTRGSTPFLMLDQLNERVFKSGQSTPAIEVSRGHLGPVDQTWLVTKVPVFCSKNQVGEVVTVGVDITKLKRVEAQIKHLAEHDALTGLPNRTLFRRKLEMGLLKKREEPTTLALLYIDFDRFKDINDQLGHDAGDRFLADAAQRLRSCLRPSDTLARLGGDEFAVILEGIGGRQDAGALAERLRLALDRPINFAGQHWSSTISMGISLSPQDGTEPEELRCNADLALYEAKAKGGNTICFFAERTRQKQRLVRELKKDLRNAISENELLLHYQPKFRCCDHSLCGLEALLRWNHPKRGPIPPADFIPVAEASDLIIKLGEFVLRRACAQIAAWQNEGIDPPPIAINLSAAQFLQQDVSAMIVRALNEAGVPSHLLELEVTESILLANSQSVQHTLKTVREMGIAIALDDFGTGYSSLSYLGKFPIDKIKIDKAFVQAICQGDQSDFAIVRAIIAMAHSLGIDVVAEGVETEAQFKELKDMGCDELQGFYLSKAEPADNLASWLRLGTSTNTIEAPTSHRRYHAAI